jgi:hypothetical protein
MYIYTLPNYLNLSSNEHNYIEGGSSRISAKEFNIAERRTKLRKGYTGTERMIKSFQILELVLLIRYYGPSPYFNLSAKEMP